MVRMSSEPLYESPVVRVSPETWDGEDTSSSSQMFTLMTATSKLRVYERGLTPDKFRNRVRRESMKSADPWGHVCVCILHI